MAAQALPANSFVLFSLTANRCPDNDDTKSTGAKVYITGRRMEALENATGKHSPESDQSSGSILSIGPAM